MNLVAERICIIESVLAGGTLTGNNGTNLTACASGFKSCFSKACAESVNVTIFDTGNLNSQSCCEHHVAVAVLLCRVDDRLTFLGGNASVTGDDTTVEFICSLVMQESQSLNTLDVVGTQSTALACRGNRTSVYSVDIFLQSLCGKLHGFAATAVFVFITCSQCSAVNGPAVHLFFKRFNKPAAQLLEIVTSAVLSAENTDSSGKRAAGASAAHSGTESGEKCRVGFSQAQFIYLIGRQKNGFRTAFVQSIVIVTCSFSK